LPAARHLREQFTYAPPTATRTRHHDGDRPRPTEKGRSRRSVSPTRGCGLSQRDRRAGRPARTKVATCLSSWQPSEARRPPHRRLTCRRPDHAWLPRCKPPGAGAPPAGPLCPGRTQRASWPIRCGLLATRRSAVRDRARRGCLNAPPGRRAGVTGVLYESLDVPGAPVGARWLDRQCVFLRACGAWWADGPKPDPAYRCGSVVPSACRWRLAAVLEEGSQRRRVAGRPRRRCSDLRSGRTRRCGPPRPRPRAERAGAARADGLRGGAAVGGIPFKQCRPGRSAALAEAAAPRTASTTWSLRSAPQADGPITSPWRRAAPGSADVLVAEL